MIEIYTDGSCLQNPGNGGWAAIINYEGNLLSEHDLLSSENISKKNIISRIWKSINYLIWGDV